MPFVSHTPQICRAKADFYTDQRTSIQNRVSRLQTALTSINNRPALASQFATEHGRATKQLTNKNKCAGYMRQRADGSPRLTPHLGLIVRSVRFTDRVFGSHLSAKHALFDGGFRKTLGRAEELKPGLRELIDSPYKKITLEQYGELGNVRALNKNLSEQTRELKTCEGKLKTWTRRSAKYR